MVTLFLRNTNTGSTHVWCRKMSSRHRNQLPHNLPQLQNLIKRDPASYKDEFMQQYHHFQANLQLFRMQPAQESKTIQDLVMFLSQVATCYPQELADFPDTLQDLLKRFAPTMDSEVRMSLCQALMVLRSKNVVDATTSLELFFELFRVQDKLLRKTLYSFIVNDIKRLNLKHRNNKVNRELQNFMFTMVKDSSPVAAKMSLDVMMELYHKNIWNDDKTVNVVVTACFSPITKIMVAAVKFFLSSDEEEGVQGDSSDSSDSEPESATVKKILLSQKVSRKTKKKEKKTKRALAALKKHKKKRKGPRPLFSGLYLIHDPQDFAEKLLKRLERSKEKFEVKLLMMNLISKLIGVHQLFVLNFYPFLQRYIHPHQHDVTKVLVYLAQACHELVPPEVVLPCVRAITDNFITERNSSEVMAVGLNAVREVSARCPLVMSSELLQDLTGYKKHREKSVVMAARSLIQLFRDSNPELLHKRDRGRPTEHEVDTAKEYGEMKPKEFVTGVELLGHSDSKTEDNENDTDVDNDSDKEDNSDNETSDNDSDSEVEEDDGREMEKDNDSGDDVQPENREPGNIADMNEDSNGSTSLQLSEGGHQTESGRREDLQSVIEEGLKQRKERAVEISQSRFLTQEEFEHIRAKQMAQKLEPRMSRKRKAQQIEKELDPGAEAEEERGEFVTLRDIAFVHKKRKVTREEKIAQVKAGREGREKYGFKKKRLNPYASTTNKEKAKNKAFNMAVRKKAVQRKQKRSFREKQIALRNSLLKRQKSKR